MHWVTFFPNLSYEHLTKDVGLLPLHMQNHDFKVDLVYTGSDIPEAKVSDEVSKLSLKKLNGQGKKMFLEKAFITFLHREASNIDVLNLYHYDRDTIYYGTLYKKLNPKGFLYIKLDGYNQHLKSRKIFSKSKLKNLIFSPRVRKFHKEVDLLSIENTLGFEIAINTYPEWKEKLIYLPNGCNDRFLENIEDQKKENTILSVGRLGSPDKNYGLLLQSLKFLNLENWQLKIIGPITADFQAQIDDLQKANPDIFKRVQITGPIYNRELLYAEFARSKVFVLPSRFESFGIAFVEALYYGNVLVGHDNMSAYADLSNQGKYGAFYDDNDAVSLAEAIKSAQDMSQKEGLGQHIRRFAAENFYWSKLSRILSSRIRNES